MTKREKMLVKGVGKFNGKSLFRDLKGYPDGIFYYEDRRTGLLFRQILPQDIEIMKEAGETAARERIINYNGQLFTSDKLSKPVSDDKILKIINDSNPSKGIFSIAVFNIKRAQFICIIDIEPIENTDENEAKLLIGFCKNLVTKNRYGKLVKKRFNEICIESNLFPKGCKEKVWNGYEYKLVSIE